MQRYHRACASALALALVASPASSQPAAVRAQTFGRSHMSCIFPKENAQSFFKRRCANLFEGS